MWMQLFNLKELVCKVHAILNENPEARDNDRLLLVEIWVRESAPHHTLDFFRELLNGKIAFPDTVTRIRRKLQEKHEDLRGKKWKSRHYKEKDVCSQLQMITYPSNMTIA